MKKFNGDIRHSMKVLLAKNSVTRPMKYIVSDEVCKYYHIVVNNQIYFRNENNIIIVLLWWITVIINRFTELLRPAALV